MSKEERLKMHTSSLADEKFSILSKYFPNALTETIDEEGKVVRAIDADVLKQEINTHVLEGREERYQFTWPDKRKAMILANSEVSSTLRPCREESVDFDNTENLYIEGDNLEVLKLLRETYLNKVKMIYIDPPYNTGNDFVYEDDFSEDVRSFLSRDGQYDELGNRLVSNLESNGRFHTDWLNMIYSRLKVAKDLLTEDGVIFISIDDNEVDNLRKICNEIFGEVNFVNCFAWINNLKGRQIREYGAAATYEYILCYAKRRKYIEPFVGALTFLKEVMPDTYRMRDYEVRQDHKGKYVVKNELYNTNSAFNEETRPTLVFDILYDPLKEEVKTTTVGGEIAPGFVRVSPHVNANGIHKYHAWRWSRKKIEEESEDLEFEPSGDSFRIYTKIRDFDQTSVKDLITNISTTAGAMELKELGLERYFPYPKPTALVSIFIHSIAKNDDIILDFFSGSSSTAQAVMKLNALDNGSRAFIMIQLPEKTSEDTEAYKDGYKNICEIGKERIRRAGSKIKEDTPLTTQNLDIGFRVLKLDSSNMKDVFYTPEEHEQLAFPIDGLADNIKEDRTDEDLLFQVMLELGIPLSASIKKVDNVFYVDDESKYLVACFDRVDTDLLTQIAKQKPQYAVFRDHSFDSDSDMVNFEQIFATYSPETTRRIL